MLVNHLLGSGNGYTNKVKKRDSSTEQDDSAELERNMIRVLLWIGLNALKVIIILVF